jgi:ABC-type transport system substrate-binding protein
MFNKRGRLRPITGVVLLGAVIAAGCGGGSGNDDGGGSALDGSTATTVADQGQPKVGGDLTVVHVSNPSSLDPQTGGSGNDHFSLYPLYDRLVNFTPDSIEPLPGLATSWSFPDPKTLVFELQSGVTFQDGTPFDAAAVKYNIERGKTLARSTVKADLASIDSVEVTSPTEVKLNLNRPDSALILILADRAGMMVSPTAAEQWGDQFPQHPVGTGPFTFVEWRQGESLRLAKNPAYWQAGKPYVDGISFRYLTDLQTGTNALRAGETDVKVSIDPADVDALSRDQAIEVSTAPSVLLDMCLANFATGPMSDLRFRQAVNYAIDRDAMNTAVAFGGGEPGVQIVPEDHWAYQPELAGAFQHDPDRARQLLRDAGMEGVTLRVVSPEGTTYARRNEVMQAQLKEVGINMTIEQMEVSASAKSFFEGLSHDMYCSAWTGRPDPNQSMSAVYSSTGYFNAGKLVVPGLDALITEAGSGTIEERAEAYGPLITRVQEEAMQVPIMFRPSINAWRDDVAGFQPNLLGKPDLSFLWFDR